MPGGKTTNRVDGARGLALEAVLAEAGVEMNSVVAGDDF